MLISELRARKYLKKMLDISECILCRMLFERWKEIERAELGNKRDADVLIIIMRAGKEVTLGEVSLVGELEVKRTPERTVLWLAQVDPRLPPRVIVPKYISLWLENGLKHDFQEALKEEFGEEDDED